MARRPKKPPAGAPAWVLTYGDMMSLLLCFFIMLAALANFDEQDKMLMTAVESIRQALGGTSQKGWMPDNVVDFKSLLVRFETMSVPDKKLNLGQSEEPGTEGQYYRVRKVRDGVHLTIGGPIAFKPFSADIAPEADGLLRQLANELRGKQNKIEVRGHTTTEPLPPDCPYPDHLELGYARARNVRDRLIEMGLDPRTVRVGSAGSSEPALKRAYTDERRSANRRVEIMVTQATLSDYEPTEPEEPLTP